jgi:hypothetical protein
MESTMNYRKGDRVSIVGTIKHTPATGERVFMELPDYHTDIWVSQDVVTLVQADFEVGDKCSWGNDGTDTYREGTILAISDGHAWIDLGGGNYFTRMLTTIERVDSDD